MEHRGTLVIGLLGFGFVAYVLIKAASVVNTHPDLDHFVPTPTKPVAGEVALRDPTPTIDRVAARLADDSEVATMELLVDVAAAQYLDRAREQLRGLYSWLPADFPCELRSKKPSYGKAGVSDETRRRGTYAWVATIRCMDEKQGYEVTVPLNFVFEDGRWDLDPATRAVLNSGGLLAATTRSMPADEHRLALTPAARPTLLFPRRTAP